MNTSNYVFQTFQFRLNLNGTKPQFAETFRHYITEAEIIRIEGSGHPLRWGWVFLERAWILGKIQFTTHFMDFFCANETIRW